MKYLLGQEGKKPPPPGEVLVHNHIRPAPRLGLNGFRAWTEPLNDKLER